MSISKSTVASHRKAIESLYDSMATITTVKETRNKENGQMVSSVVTLYEVQPCRVSSKTNNQAVEADLYKDKKQDIKLFIAPELEIPIGAKIAVTKNKKTTNYSNAGKAFNYDSHQEILLKTGD